MLSLQPLQIELSVVLDTILLYIMVGFFQAIFCRTESLRVLMPFFYCKKKKPQQQFNTGECLDSQ